MAKEHSDWDFVMFTKEDMHPLTREIVSGANIEVKQIILPVPEGTFLGFYFHTENTKVLHDPESIAKDLLEQNDIRIKKGNAFDESDRIKRYAFFSSALDGIQDYADNPLVLFDKKMDFHSRIVESWFRFFKKEFEPSHYIAYRRIEKEDPEFFVLIKEFVERTDAEGLVRVGKEITKRLFPDL